MQLNVQNPGHDISGADSSEKGLSEEDQATLQNVEGDPDFGDSPIPSPANGGQDDLSVPRRTCRSFFSVTCLILVSLGCSLLGLQLLVYFRANQCRSFGSHTPSRLERVSWLCPLYILAPWVSLTLVLTFVSHRGRYVPSMFQHRWTWRFAVSNFLASVFASFPLFLRDCPMKQHSRSWDFQVLRAFVTSGDVGWLVCYAVSEMILLCLVYHKLKMLSQMRSATLLRYTMVSLLTAWLAIMLPIIVWAEYTRSFVRIIAGGVFVTIFIACMAIATSGMLSAAREAKKIARKSEKVQEVALRAIQWTRWTAYVSMSSMASSIVMQAALLCWMYNNFPRNYLRIIVDWLEAFDFILNTLCAASLSGMVGPQDSLELVENAFEQVGTLLGRQTEGNNDIGEPTAEPTLGNELAIEATGDAVLAEQI